MSYNLLGAALQVWKEKEQGIQVTNHTVLRISRCKFQFYETWFEKSIYVSVASAWKLESSEATRELQPHSPGDLVFLHTEKLRYDVSPTDPSPE